MSSLTKYLLLFGCGFVLCWIVLGGCGGKVTTNADVKTSDSLRNVVRIVAKAKTEDSMRFVVDRGLNEIEINRLQTENNYLNGSRLATESEIKKLTANIRIARNDTPIVWHRLLCDSLVENSERLVWLNEIQRKNQRFLDSAYMAQIDIIDSSRMLCEDAYLKIYNAAQLMGDLNAKLIKDKKRSGFQVYAGASGLYQPQGLFGGGGSILVKTKGDKIYRGTYYLTNAGALYEFGAAFKISFRK